MSKTTPKPKRQYDPRAKAIGERIRTKRELLGFTTDELAGMLGVTGNAITQYETGRAIPKPNRFEALAVALGTNTTWLLTGDEPDEQVKAQTKTELEALTLLREIPLEQHPMVLAAIRGMASVKPKK
ncbi:helix-turn-helix domain-containing protein [Acetobacter orientalis]|uniref:helix-turn-helix domain-containing protein n=1 Tax=Acetobacter orientalis TaxID=146474 RepID=UPI0020A61409|nr:helix-turn-helix domain-containing protein [Acetobacter orientalis]MCP1221353.1 helix-turn-helix domain-containing protein [Acetobacter orientalis]